MEKPKSKIYIIGVFHYSKKDGQRIREYGNTICPDAIFLERAKEGKWGIKPRELLLSFLRNPLSFIFAILHRAGSRLETYHDRISCEMVSRKLQIPLRKIDDNIYQEIVSRRTEWTVISWGMVFAISLIAWINLWWLFAFIFSGLVMYYLTFLYSGIPIRNQHMAERIDEILRAKVHNKIFLITGKAHISDFTKRLFRYDVVVLD